MRAVRCAAKRGITWACLSRVCARVASWLPAIGFPRGAVETPVPHPASAASAAPSVSGAARTLPRRRDSNRSSDASASPPLCIHASVAPQSVPYFLLFGAMRLVTQSSNRAGAQVRLELSFNFNVQSFPESVHRPALQSFTQLTRDNLHFSISGAAPSAAWSWCTGRLAPGGLDGS